MGAINVSLKKEQDEYVDTAVGGGGPASLASASFAGWGASFCWQFLSAG
jgi:hypothetical protein